MGELKGFRVGPDRGRGNVRVYKLYISIDFDAHCLTGESYQNQCSVDGQSGLGSTVAACALALPPSHVTKVESVAGAVAGRVPQVAGRRREGRSEGPAFLPAR